MLEDPWTPERIAKEVRELAALMARSDSERLTIEVALNSVIQAMARVAPKARGEMRALVAAVMANPDDKEIVAKLRALLATAGRKCH